MKSKITLLINKNRDKLHKLIDENAATDKILKQSIKLDRYILMGMAELNKTRS